VLAARFHAAHDIRIEEVPEPERDLASREVLVEPRWCGICGTDLHEYIAGPIVTPAQPHALTGATLPQILGHEFAGDVLDVGDGVTHVAPGDRVSIMPLAYCGDCHFCRRGLNHLCSTMGCVGLSWEWGGFASRAIVRDYQAWLLPDAVSYEQGALIEPAAVAAYGVSRGGVAPGDRVLVTGAGPIGALTVLAALAAGAGEVYLAEPNEHRARRAEVLGAAAIFDASSTDVAGEVRERTGGLGVDVAIECSGNEAALTTCLAATRARGTVAQVGLHIKPATFDPMALAEREISIVGTWAYSVHEWPRITGQVASGAFPVERVVSDRIPLAEIVTRGFDVLTDPAGDQVKILVAPASPPALIVD
jgi:(R,R)-butanediol dehydrogenase/meso-butanediol dehydrogenase/diacetyl reductase